MPKALWKGATLAECDSTIVVDGNHYFPSDSIRRDHFLDSDAHTACGWKGTANYYDVAVGDEVNEQAAWYYPDPKPKAAHIKDRVAFWKGVEVID